MTRLMVVDDEPIIRAGLMKLIRQYNPHCDVVGLPNGAAALEQISRQAPDLVLTDIRMPKMDGLELCRQIDELQLQIKTIVISGYSDFCYAQKCLTYGVKEYLLKPITEKELYPVLDKLLSEEDPHSISLIHYEEWLEQVEEAIWSVNVEEVSALAEQWVKSGYAHLKISQLQQFAEDGLTLLVKKLNSRNVFRFQIESTRKLLASRTEVIEYLKQELDQLCNQLYQWRGGSERNLFEEAKAYIDQHITEEISLEAVAEKVGLAPTYFSFYFKKMTNETFVQYRMRKRIEIAKKLLELPHYKIVDVGMEIGYQNYPHFTKIFKKITGLSPTEYRQLLGIR
ncbi:response regulator [Paenibacillus sp. J2TS4]|uniref:response regulator transcription factor n=1 Tax=Paenibacillus sp. J2TS4 TaxID=2807194 RepID=UPI001B15E16D|nr:response regulator [Paenibacillus sp. J2TS4]GIP33248.1 DNA-binding response regulator [Paenibacillus sp. J2TS4]